ncbi:CerR family C-terminal domain-containing protein [Desulfobulbus elongatus]|uniref:CerR family C-terminal domain-containing protein n=1 Tax=Desulfobulbus elongatus TaxID=53332 RepID=UPI0004844FD3|nr:CerR family C-terminal domain-containing protein [Desulfobulbus elongatus]
MNTNAQPPDCANRERGDTARRKLIEAGLKIYSEVGYQSAPTRRLASAAGVNIAAIPYYFGNKEGLYHAVLDHIVAHYLTHFGPCLERIEQALAEPTTTRDGYLALLDEYMRLMVHFVLRESDDCSQISRIYIREQLDPTSGFERLYNGFIKKMRETHEALVAVILGMDVRSLEVKLITQTLIGQVVIFKSSRVTVLQHMGWQKYGEERMAAIERIVSDNVRAVMAAHRNKDSEL